MVVRLSRRQTLKGLLLGSTGVGMSAGSSGVAAQTPPSPQGVCRLFPQAVEGPYYFDPGLLRADITEGRPGLPLHLMLQVIESGSCAPMRGARVDIWHADAGGVYSGYAGQGDAHKTSTKGEKYLRGTQMSDESGRVEFRSIYPGWYPGRTPHIHVKVFLDKTTLVTGQIYFADELSARVYAGIAPYAERPNADTTNATDGIFKDGERQGGGIVFLVAEEQNLLKASLVIAVDRSGEATRKQGGWGRFIRRRLGW